MTSASVDVPAQVRAAFGLTGEAVPLTGGQGSSIRIGDAVLKPVDGAVEETGWAAGIAERLGSGPGFQVPRPLRATDGRCVVDDWCGAEYLPGEPGPAGRWDELLAAGRAFHAALRDEPRPGFLSGRTHRWAMADRVAWGEESATQIEVAPGLRSVLGELTARRRPVGEARNQLVHGDLAGNVLFPAGGDPVVIDFSPYWRPVGFAEAVVVVDGLLWYGAPDELLERGAGDPGWFQVLLRALIFRLGAEGSGGADVVRRYRELGVEICRRDGSELG
jgi:uncharacterized protein (TIGR02569 family)